MMTSGTRSAEYYLRQIWVRLGGKIDVSDPDAAPLQVDLVNENNLPLAADAISNNLSIIDHVHHEVHEGEMFHAGNLFLAVANSSNVDLQITSGASRYVHIVFSVSSGGTCRAFLYEAPTTTGGTPVSANNMKRTETMYIPQSSIAHTPAVTATGTALISRIIPGGGAGANRIGGATRSEVEWILKQNTKYMVRVTNTSGGAVDVSISMEWYEEATN